jgi:N-acetylmuramoyl-L-alanine amidase/putative methionine-R-sulfoxide reductase with GAF domain
LQALLAFSSLHEQIRQRRAREALSGKAAAWSESPDQFVLYEVLQLVAERAQVLTGADGVAVALVQEGEIVCRGVTGAIAPDLGARLNPQSGISGICFRTAETVRCDDAEHDPRVDSAASRQLHARSMVAVPLCGRKSVIGLLEAFSTEAYAFNESDVKSLTLLAELILGAIKPDEEERLESLSPAPLKRVAIHGQVPKSSDKSDDPVPVSSVAPSVDVAPPEATLASSTEVKAENCAPPPTSHIVPSERTVLEHPEIGTLELQDIKISELFAVPDPQPVSTATTTKPVSEEPQTEPAIFGGYREPTSSRPGLGLVFAFAGIAIVAAGILWWWLHSKNAAEPATAASVPISSPATTSQPAVEPTAAATPVEQQPAADSTADVPLPTPTSPDEAARSVLPVVSSVRHWESGATTTVVIDLQDQVQYEVHRLSSPERIYFDLHDTTLSSALAGGKTIEVGDSLLARIRVAQPVPGVSRVVLETKGVSTFSVSLESNPYRLVAEIRSSGEKQPGSDVLKPQPDVDHKLTSSGSEPQSAAGRMKVVVDAGHGGWDLGTVGRKGLLEKDLVLDVAQRLGKLLQSRLNADVIFTRTDDNYIPLEKRAEMANDAQADLFISVHANYSDIPSARGVETYYTTFSSPTNTLDIEKRENATAKTSPSAPALTGIALKERTAESRRLAASIERSLYSSLSTSNPGIRDRGVKEAGFVVLTGTSMPAILAEVSFVSSPTDEKNLQSAAYRQQIAEALFKGIARYQSGNGRVKLASASSKPTGR